MSEPAKAPSSTSSWSVKETWTAAALFLGTMLSRLPFRSQILYHWDSVNFAFAMQHFDVAADQPQSPGYIAYVWLCRLVDVLFHDPQTTMVWLSIVGSGLAVVAMYLLGRAVFGRRVGLVAALFLVSSPLFWFYGEIALPHAVDAFLVILSAWLLYEVMLGQVWAMVPAAASLAVAGGVRQQTPVFVRFLQRVGWGRGWRWGVLAVGVFGLLCAGWFLPLIDSAGGLARYLQVVGAFSERFDRTTSVFLGAGMGGVSRNLRKLGMYTLYGWSVALLPLAVYGLMRLWRRQLTVQWKRALFLLAWVFPSLFFYTLIHMGQQGLVFVFLPVLLLVSAQALVRLVEGQERTALTAGMIMLVVVNAALFAVLPEYPLGKKHFKVLSWDTLRHNDTYFAERFAAIRQHFPAQSTVIIASRWRHVQWYLPEYVYLPFVIAGKREKDAGSPINTGCEERAWIAEELGLSFSLGDTMTVVLFDRELGAFNMNPDLIQSLALRDGAELEFMILQE
jgi:4-amino-4-deoxy-L-arabinose transferase-like glycosyltransferase